MQQNYRSSADDDQNKDREYASAEGKSGGNAGAGKSGSEDLGSEKKVDDERFGSRKADGRDHQEDEGKKDAPGKKDEPAKKG
ncbi:MAG TPA: hypothetical protein VNA17_10425 [Pyrinomonadaceae bacterium]|nr:hypothetical protein [Pyrinomonadaceae bacterium]